MWWVVIVAVGVFLLALSVLRGAPWLPTRKSEIETALEMLNLAPQSRVIDLGSGGGGFLLAAAKADLYATGYEINPLLCFISYIRTWRYRDRVRIVCGDYWLHTLPECEGIFVFLIDHFMPKLAQKLEKQAAGGTKVVSYIFKIPSKKSIKSKNGLFLYRY